MQGEFDEARLLIREANVSTGRRRPDGISGLASRSSRSRCSRETPRRPRSDCTLATRGSRRWARRHCSPPPRRCWQRRFTAQGRYEEAATFLCAVSQATADPGDRDPDDLAGACAPSSWRARRVYAGRRGTRPRGRPARSSHRSPLPSRRRTARPRGRSSAGGASPTRRRRRFGPVSSCTHARETSFSQTARGHSWRWRRRDSPPIEPLETVTQCGRSGGDSTRASARSSTQSRPTRRQGAVRRGSAKT